MDNEETSGQTELRGIRKDIDKRFSQVDKRFGEVDNRFEKVDRQFKEVYAEFARIHKKMDSHHYDLKQDNARLLAVVTESAEKGKVFYEKALSNQDILGNHESRLNGCEKRLGSLEA